MTLADLLLGGNPQQQAMLGMGASLMAQGGPSPTPIGFGQGLGSAFLQMQQRNMQMQQQAQAQRLRERQLTKLERELDLSEREEKVLNKLADQMEAAGRPDLLSTGVRLNSPALLNAGAAQRGLGQRPSGAHQRMQELIAQGVPPDRARAIAYSAVKEFKDPLGYPVAIDISGGGELGRMQRDPANPSQRVWKTPGAQPLNPSQRVWKTPGAQPSGNKDLRLRQAREAIAGGKDMNAVLQMLKQLGIDPSGL
mgnify:CR=1 FL=1